MADAPEPKQKPVIPEFGDLVEVNWNGYLYEGIIEEISDGSERNMPGELMYLVSSPEWPAARWIKHWEVVKVLDPEAQLAEAVHLYHHRTNTRAWYNNLVLKTIVESTKKLLNFRGRL